MTWKFALSALCVTVLLLPPADSWGARSRRWRPGWSRWRFWRRRRAQSRRFRQWGGAERGPSFGGGSGFGEAGHSPGGPGGFGGSGFGQGAAGRGQAGLGGGGLGGGAGRRPSFDGGSGFGGAGHSPGGPGGLGGSGFGQGAAGRGQAGLGGGGLGLGGSVAIDSRLPVAANSTVSLVCPPTRGCTTSVQRASVAEMSVSGAAGIGGGRPGLGEGGVGRPGVGVGGVGRPGVGVGGVGRPGVGIGGVGGFNRVSASARYTTATAVRTNFNRWDIYGRGWYGRYPAAWFATGWAAGAAWRSCAWGTCASYCGYSETPPVYYDYGNNVTYEDNSVYVNGDSVGTTEQYYDQAASIASTGATAERRRTATGCHLACLP